MASKRTEIKCSKPKTGPDPAKTPTFNGNAAARRRNLGRLCYICHMPRLRLALQLAAFAVALNAIRSRQQIVSRPYVFERTPTRTNFNQAIQEWKMPPREWPRQNPVRLSSSLSEFLTGLRSRTLSRPTWGGSHRSYSVTSYEIILSNRLGGQGCKTV